MVGRAAPDLHSEKDSIFWKVKVRLQWSGWLQYIPVIFLGVVFLLLAAIGKLVGSQLFFQVPFCIGLFLLLVTAFDVLTVKLDFRPSERTATRRDNLDAFDLMRSRVSCRSFQSRMLTAGDKEELLACVTEQTKASALLGKLPIRFEYIAKPLTVWPAVGCHEFLVAIAPKEYNRTAVIDVGRSLQKVVLHATRMGLATCWIGPGADQESVVSQLGDRFDHEKDHVICVCAVGYASGFSPLLVRIFCAATHSRVPLASLFFKDPTFAEPLDTTAAPFNRFGRCYEVCQWAPSSFNAQTTRCAAVVEERGGQDHLTRFDFGVSTKSRFYAMVALGIWLANWETGCQALGIAGRWAVLPPEERKVVNAPELPLYDISWVLEGVPLPVAGRGQLPTVPGGVTQPLLA